MKNVLIVGGANGIGLSISQLLVQDVEIEKVYIIDKAPLQSCHSNYKIESFLFDLTQDDYSFIDQFVGKVDSLIITAGFGRLQLFEFIEETEIDTYFRVNTVSVLRLIKRFYERIKAKEDFYCAVMVSIAGFMTSPFFSVYGATKAALKIFIESVNIELQKSGTDNRILNVSPGSIEGTSFNKGETDLTKTIVLARKIVENMKQKNDLLIPKYEEVYKEVLDRYNKDFRKEGLHSYEYKLLSGRVTPPPITDQ